MDRWVDAERWLVFSQVPQGSRIFTPRCAAVLVQGCPTMLSLAAQPSTQGCADRLIQQSI
jgi:hypothetical protein